jgi:hypothetical protein
MAERTVVARARCWPVPQGVDYLWGHPAELLLAALTRVALADVEDAWQRAANGRRLVLIP